MKGPQVFTKQAQGWGTEVRGTDTAPHKGAQRTYGELGEQGSLCTRPRGPVEGLGLILATFKQQEVTEGFNRDTSDRSSIVKRCSWRMSKSSMCVFPILPLDAQVRVAVLTPSA